MGFRADFPGFDLTPDQVNQYAAALGTLPEPQAIPGGHVISAARKFLDWLNPDPRRADWRKNQGLYDQFQQPDVMEAIDRAGGRSPMDRLIDDATGMSQGMGQVAQRVGRNILKNPQVLLNRTFQNPDEIANLERLLKYGVSSEMPVSAINPAFTSIYGMGHWPSLLFSTHNPGSIASAGARDLFSYRSKDWTLGPKAQKAFDRLSDIIDFGPWSPRSSAASKAQQRLYDKYAVETRTWQPATAPGFQAPAKTIPYQPQDKLMDLTKQPLTDLFQTQLADLRAISQYPRQPNGWELINELIYRLTDPKDLVGVRIPTDYTLYDRPDIREAIEAGIGLAQKRSLPLYVFDHPDYTFRAIEGLENWLANPKRYGWKTEKSQKLGRLGLWPKGGIVSPTGPGVFEFNNPVDSYRIRKLLQKYL